MRNCFRLVKHFSFVRFQNAFEKFTAQAEKREEKLYTVIAQAQETNERLSQTNAEFVSVLNTYKSDLEDIKSDVSEIKQTMKG